ncbi:nucleotidyltransferase family protein [Pseudohongiella sp. SYSU M77423]|uniref:N-acetylmuramate alpha-1-phosphate uridylyltransferase MurU n=1 Tax=unclassified Pseudohongiella TaxID=2629611 RepID=UPI001F331135|nr:MULTISPECIES: nucleotidyltransferase family protein [unclassified Pseudohongiella]MDH7943878.1 nucleotidyltransferase family protein [Pseudohongiella sp. SYSU M77423]
MSATATRAMILAAGLGQRMLPLTETTPKALLPAGDRRLIEWQIARLRQAGVQDIVINLHHLGSQIVTALGDGSRYDVRLHFSDEPERLETAGGIIRAMPMLGDQPFILTNADVWTDFNYQRLLPIARQLGPSRLAHLVLIRNAPHNPAGDFCLSDSGIVSEHGEPKLTYAGISVLHPHLFAGESERFLPLGPMLRNAMQEGGVTGEVFEGDWQDIGTPERLAALNHQLSVEKKAESGSDNLLQ